MHAQVCMCNSQQEKGVGVKLHKKAGCCINFSEMNSYSKFFTTIHNCIQMSRQ